MNNKINRINRFYNLFLGITTFCTVISSSNLVFAQIVPDNTLPNNSQIGIEGNITKIEGGTTAVSNLFHSFEKFGVSTGTEAHFNNAADIQNIITRVTGNSISDIDGLIKANSAANLFLINPNGIVFGENARLDIGGSFVGSTGDSVKFGDGLEFNAINPQGKPLLSINVPLGLQYGNNPGQISNQSQASNSQGMLTGLRVKPGKTLGLIGGDISFDTGIVSLSDGRVELGGLNEQGIVGLSGDGNNLNNLKFNFPQGVVRSDVKLTNGARVIVPADNGGSIAVNARNLEMTGQSFFLVRTVNPLGSDDSRAGNIQVNATENIRLNNSFITNLFQAQTSGRGGDVNINTNTLLVENGAVITASTLGRGKGGNLTVEAQDVQLIGVSEDGSRSSALSAFAGSNLTGDAGNLTIRTNTLLVKDGAEINSNTFGQGRGGNLSIDAQDIQVIGTSQDGSDVSALSASTEPNSTGDAGELSIKTNNLLVKDGGQIAASTIGEGKGGNLNIDARDIQVIGISEGGQFLSGLFASTEANSTGDAGELTIKTNNLLVKDGGRITTSTFGEGKGGNLTIDATDIQLIGTSENGSFLSSFSASAEPNSTGDAGELTIKTNSLLVKDGGQIGATTFGGGKGGNLSVDANNIQLIGTTKNGSFSSGLFTSAEADSTGDAGDLTVNTDILQVEDEAKLSVESLGTGRAGNLIVNADSIRLNNNALLSANTGNNEIDSDTEQAIININSRELIMRRGSNIFTNATGENVVGGNINIDTDLLVANENSDISANSENFRGGNVRINAEGVFGTQFRSQPTPQSDITATGVTEDSSGTVEVITPQSDINSALVQLPTTPEDTQIADTCSSPGYARSSFTITGKGSLPPNPSEPLTGRLNQTKLATLDEVEEIEKQTKRRIKKEEPIKQIVEAQGWIKTKDGEIILVAHNPQNTNFKTTSNSNSCNLY